MLNVFIGASIFYSVWLALFLYLLNRVNHLPTMFTSAERGALALLVLVGKVVGYGLLIYLAIKFGAVLFNGIA